MRRLYAKFFDVDWDESTQTAVPQAIISIDSSSLRDLELIPTIFITNRTFQHLDFEKIPGLAKKIWTAIQQLASHRTIPEIQIDCDWSGSTQYSYFALLKQLRQESSARCISATIRLHQLHDPGATGVPPVDRGVLMFYNMGDLEAWQEENSILNLEKAKPYLKDNPHYPLPLDLALPIFHWAVVFRGPDMIALINNLDLADLSDTSRFQKIDPGRFEVVKSTYIKGHYLYKSDKLRLESSTYPQLVAAVKLLKPIWKPEPGVHLIFYHLDTATIKNFCHESLAALCRQFIE